MELPQTLIASLRGRTILPFIGAGVSMAVKRATGERLFPSWNELLNRAADRLKSEQNEADSDYVRSAIKISPPDFLNAARQARKGLGPVWYKFLKDQFDPSFQAALESSLGLGKNIWSLGSDLIITTNYDNVLRWACPNKTDLAIWDIDAPAEMAQFLQGKSKPTVWHLHGQISNAAEIILTADGYRLLYPENPQIEIRYKAALATLKTQIACRNLLFIGWSFEDSHFGSQLDDVTETFAGAAGPHYALIPQRDLPALRKKSLPVTLIPFEDFGKPLDELLMRMTAEIQHNPTAINSSQPEIAEQRSINPKNYTFLIPYREKGAQVIGREDDLQAVRKQLVQGRRTHIGHTAAFQGFGGLGKTQLAVEYCYRFKNEYPMGVIWLNADQDIDGQLINIAEKAGWTAPNALNELKLLTAKHRLRSISDCLVVFDNLISTDRIKDYLPEAQASPHILVTSRMNHPGFEEVPLGILTPEQSLELLIQESGNKPQSESDWIAAKTVAEKLDGLPLALELAGAYLRHRAVSWEQYLILFQNNIKEALPGKFLESFTQHEKDIYSTLKINEEVFDDEPRLKLIIDILTWSASAPMGESLLSALLNAEVHELTSALGLGVKLRILQKSSLGESYALHRLVQHVRRAEFLLPENRSWVAEICERMGNWFQNIKRDYADLPRFEAEIDHLRVWQNNSLLEAPSHASRLLWLQAYPLHHRGKNEEALHVIEKSLELYKDLSVENPALKAHLLNDYGTTCNLLRNYELGNKYTKESLEMRLALLGEKHPDTAMSLHNVGMIFMNERTPESWEKAVPYFEKAYGNWKEAYGATDVDALMAEGNLIEAYFELKKEGCLELAEKLLQITKAKFGEKHPHVASRYHLLGRILFNEKGSRALDCFTTALGIRRELLGEENLFTTTSLVSLINLFCSKGLHSKAEQLLKEYLAKLPATHSDYMHLLNRKKTIYEGVFRPGFRTPKKSKKR